jgi:hypothetical protein
MLHQGDEPNEMIPPGQPEDDNADQDNLGHADPAQTEREMLRTKVNAYVVSAFKDQLSNIAPADKHYGPRLSTYSRTLCEAPGLG